MTEQLVAVLGRHPWVDSAWWDARRAALVVRPAAETVAVRPAPGAMLVEYLEHWRHVYEYVYSSEELRHGDDLDLSGWRASDTGAAFPREHMLEWIDHAVGLVRRGQPGTVIEIGCGSGLLVHRLSPSTRGYVGLDPAAPVVERLRARRLPGVSVLRAAAHELTADQVTAALRALDAIGRPDCVVLNSVTQCFPDERYLAAVLEDALDAVAPGGTVVVGDIRNLAAAPDFARWLELARAPSLGADDLTRRTAARLEADEELLCDPRVFARIARGHSRSVRVACYAKPMRDDTELTRYRYDVVLTVDAPAPGPNRSVAWRDLTGRGTADRIATLADTIRRDATMVTGIPNALLDHDAADAVAPAVLAAVAPPECAVLLDSADARFLAVGRPEHHSGVEAVRADPPHSACNDPFTRYVRRRMPEVLTDYLELLGAAATQPSIVVSEEFAAHDHHTTYGLSGRPARELPGCRPGAG
ncbi:class I SAM-dependent methyltransferase [Nocardia sp. NBC_00508]|uniref:class I SAM-dependent methyltransferase n=1 Tax=Nocardia sp. NBC_00508 TaxID=2975992 RepID=UPI002E82396C|nr:class I SAM-dependent methyltransferase [Nocardia sp. NBC_00508]WUD66662.1 class I SAM-dependent methyltransferase [Nocardia sp. NBC_00508]